MKHVSRTRISTGGLADARHRCSGAMACGEVGRRISQVKKAPANLPRENYRSEKSCRQVQPEKSCFNSLELDSSTYTGGRPANLPINRMPNYDVCAGTSKIKKRPRKDAAFQRVVVSAAYCHLLLVVDRRGCHLFAVGIHTLGANSARLCICRNRDFTADHILAALFVGQLQGPGVDLLV